MFISNILSVTDTINKYIADKMYVNLIIEAVIILGLVIFGLVLAFKYIKKLYVILGGLGLIVSLILCEVLKLEFLPWIIYLIFAIAICLCSVLVASHLKSIVNTNQKQKNQKNFVFNQETKDELIETLIKTVEHLSARKIGAIITLEKQNTLNTYITRAVQIDSIVTSELLNTIFFPNTALHDGAVIIRGNRIMCASAYYPSCEKADIPQSYGTRHRAAIGISEKTDAFTIVVSEETGKISVTISGTITSGISLDSLRVSLNQHIIVQ